MKHRRIVKRPRVLSTLTRLHSLSWTLSAAGMDLDPMQPLSISRNPLWPAVAKSWQLVLSQALAEQSYLPCKQST